MISGIQLLRSVGQFDYVPAGAIAIDRYALAYAENGRGKTTLTAILRSLATGDPLPVRERRRLGAANPPHVVLRCSTGQTPAIFENGVWNRTFPEIVIFDDRFVDENVCSGLSVEPGHRKNLHELVIGAQGVALNRSLQVLVREIEEHNAVLRNLVAAIPAAGREGLSIDEFCELPAVRDIDAQIETAARTLAAAKHQDEVRDTPAFDVLDLPAFDTAVVSETLDLALPNLEAAAAARVQEHFRDIGEGGEPWIADGMDRVARADGGNESCPFCAQNLAGSGLIVHYREYFSRAYEQLKGHIAQTLNEVGRAHPRDVPGRFERSLRIAVERRQFWSQFCEVPEIALQTEHLMAEWHASRDGVIGALAAKQAAPLDRMQLPEPVRASAARFAEGLAIVRALNEELQRANAAIGVIKQRAAAGDSAAAERMLTRLRATRARHTPETNERCLHYLEARAAKAATEARRDETQRELERYRAREFPQYENAINTYLRLFNAGYRVTQVTPADTRGGPTCNYAVSINDIPIPISSGGVMPGEPAFKSTLSSGDRSTLALAFFFAALDRDPNLAAKVIVIDDPPTSLDEHRSLATVQQLRRLGERASQVIVLSHDRALLSRIWKGIDQAHCTAIKLEREGNGSNIVPWDITGDTVTEHDRNHALLRSYLQAGGGIDSREVASAIRPVLEAFLRVAYPEHFPPRDGAMGQFRGLCRRNLGTAAEILNLPEIQELDDLVEYGNLFHHNTNPAYQNVIINDAQLSGYVGRALSFTTRSPLLRAGG
jgi:wobble nucleotide-excising tRNase